jgi:hypothetical protein
MQARLPDFFRQKHETRGGHTDVEHPKPWFKEPGQQIREHRADGNGKWDSENRPKDQSTLPEIKKVKCPTDHVPGRNHKRGEHDTCLQDTQRIGDSEIVHMIAAVFSFTSLV